MNKPEFDTKNTTSEVLSLKLSPRTSGDVVNDRRSERSNPEDYIFVSSSEATPITYETDLQAFEVISSAIIRGRSTPVKYTRTILFPRLR